MGDVVTVEQFMRFALYHPRVGYYVRHVRGVGPRGDFATAPSLSPILGIAVARWLAGHGRGNCLFRPWHIIEVGAGDGSLALALSKALGPLARARLSYHIVEVSHPLREIQMRHLRGRRFRWHDDMNAALAACRGRATIVANEVADAFPAVQWAWSAGRWREVGVRLGPGHPEEVLLEPDIERARRWCPDRVRFPGHPAEGDRFEMHLSYAEWLASWVPALSEGAILTMDYGGENLPAQPHGSFRAYWHHQSLRGIEAYLRPGHQDLTADVDFSDLRRWGELQGLRTEWTGPQGEFIRRWVPDRARDSVSAFLTDPAGAGGAFRVLDQRRGAVR